MKLPDRPAALPAHAQVAVVGAGISGLALAFQLQHRGIDVQVLEANDRPGGNIRSEVRDGYLCEWGPNGWLDNEPATERLVAALGLQDQVVRASDLAHVRWIVRDGKLRALPAGPRQFLGSDVLSFGGRLRVLLEWAQPARRDGADESVFEFAARRIGHEAAAVLVDAMVTGVYAGDSRRLSLQSAFPRMRDMEVRHGGLFKAMRAMRRERRRAPQTTGDAQAHSKPSAGGPMGPAGTLTSFVNGMETLVRALQTRLEPRLHLATPVATLVRAHDRWRLASTDGRALAAERVVVASPAWMAAPLLADLDPELGAGVGSIQSAPVVVVCLGFAERDVQPVPRGFGFLVPGRENLPILGTLFDTWVFPNRSQPGHVLFRTMIGGARDPGAVDAGDDDLVDRALSTLQKLLGLRSQPEMIYVVRHRRGIPQYPVGHAATLAQIDSALRRHPGLFLTGNCYRGISMNSCIKDVESVAEQLAATFAPTGAEGRVR
jgi:protoporphyrinogen/coproporphyrinogen III oxidase